MILNHTMITIKYRHSYPARTWLIALCFAAVYTKFAFGQSCPSATLKQNLNFSQSAGTVITSNKYDNNSSMVSHGWQPISHVPIQGKADFVTVHPADSNLLFIGTNGNLYASFNQGKDWKRLMGLGANAKINRLYFEENRMFLLSSEGLFESTNQGKDWKKIFQGRQKNESNMLSLSRDPQNPKTLYLGTEGGLFVSRDAGKTWQKETNELAHQLIHGLETDRENSELFIATEKGLYRSLPHRNQLDRVYVTKNQIGSEEIDLDSEVADDPDLELSTHHDQVQTIIVTNYPLSVIAIGTQNGVFVSEDEGNHWERLPLSGLQSVNVLDLAYSPKENSFFAATEKGVYFYDRSGKHWKELHEGLPLVQVNRLVLVSGEPEVLYAATNQGVYQIKIEIGLNRPESVQPFPQERWNLAYVLFRSEPTVGMIQKQAIRYANVSNWKTRRWQWTSRLRALVPSFSVGKKFSKSDNIDIDRGGTGDPDKFIFGPADRTRSLDFGLNWDLSDMIWNSYQTSIDSREKLMVELRDDILSEVTRLYFERRRAQAEFILKPPTNPLDRTNQLLRIDELTANLDALTNSYLTKELNRIYAEHPEFQELWNERG